MHLHAYIMTGKKGDTPLTFELNTVLKHTKQWVQLPINDWLNGKVRKD